MENMIYFMGAVLLFQVVLFFFIRRKKQQYKKDDILIKYGINSRGDLFRVLQNPELEELDREKLQRLYEGGFSAE